MNKITHTLTGLVLQDIEDLLQALDLAIEKRKPDQQTERWVKARHEITKSLRAIEALTKGQRRNDEVAPENPWATVGRPGTTPNP